MSPSTVLCFDLEKCTIRTNSNRFLFVIDPLLIKDIKCDFTSTLYL